jgi:hypothetical protein
MGLVKVREYLVVVFESTTTLVEGEATQHLESDREKERE